MRERKVERGEEETRRRSGRRKSKMQQEGRWVGVDWAEEEV